MKSVIRMLLALFLCAVPASEAAAGHTGSPIAISSVVQALDQFEWHLPVKVMDLRGYALADELDELGKSRETIGFVLRFVEIIKDPSLLDLVKTVSEPELRASVDASLAERVDRLALLLTTATELVIAEVAESTSEDLTNKEAMLSAFESMVIRLDDRTRPVAERRLLRHSLRGMSALLCLSGRPESITLQTELLDHAIVGYESVLRFSAGSSDSPEWMRVVELGLEPVDRDAFERRAARLAAGRAALDEAREIDPEFSLPPDPAFHDTPRD